MAKSRLKTSSLALVFFLVLLVANVAITSVSAAGLSVGLPGTTPPAPSPTPQQTQSQQTQPTPTQQTPTSQQQQPSSPPPQTQTSDNQNHQSSQQPAPNPTDNNNNNNNNNTPPPQASSQAPEGSKSTPVTGDNNVVYTTLTSYSSFLPVPTGVPSSATAANSNSGGSDSSSNVVVPAIVVGSVVVAAALGIWIFRKWKLSPSRDFKEKIQPIDFSPSAAREDSVFLRELNEP